MSGWLDDATSQWQGRPVARRVADVAERRRAVLTGTVRSVVVHRRRPVRGRIHPLAHGGDLDAYLDDGTGTITLRWLGREAIAGVVVGATLHAEGTVASESTRLLILNPLYRFVAPEPASGHDGTRRPGSRENDDGAPGATSERQAESSTSW